MTDRMTALTSRYHYLITIYPTPDHADLGGFAIRAATGMLSKTGEVITVGGHSYPPGVDSGISVTRSFSVAPEMVTFSILMDELVGVPADLDLSNATGVVQLANEAAGGGSVSSDLETWIRGRVTRWQWGERRELLTITLQGDSLQDRGDWYVPGAELDSIAFPDLDNTGDRDRAHHAAGRLPPLVYAPTGCSTWMPLDCVADEVNADGVTDLVPRRWLVGYRQPADTSSQQFYQIDPDNPDAIIRGLPDATVYQTTILSDQDGNGATYYYVDGDFIETSTTGNAHWTATSTTVTFATGSARKLREGWQARAATGSDANDWCVITSQDGTQIELDRAYTGSTSVNDDSQSIPLAADRPGGLMWVPSLGGIAGDDGQPISNVVDFLIDLLRMSDFPGVTVAWGDLECLRARCAAVRITYYRNTRGKPWDTVQSVLDWLPVRAYLAGGHLRFRWIGDYQESDIRTEFDLTEYSTVQREGSIESSIDVPSPVIGVSYLRDFRRGVYTRKFTLNGSGEVDESSIGSTGKSMEASQLVRGLRVVPDLQIDIDTLASKSGAVLAAQWSLDRYGFKRDTIKLSCTGCERWLEPGDLVYIYQPEAVANRRVWRVETFTLDASGEGSMVLESVDCTAGTYYRQRLWGDGTWDGTMWP